MHNEVYSLMAAEGAPSWYITFAPSDQKHPISLYWADEHIEFSPLPQEEHQHLLLITGNPTAAAWFFNFMVQLFLEHVLCADQSKPGAYSNVSSYYGAMEQQGQLTLHLHLIAWIRNALSPQEICDRLIGEDSEFQKQLFAYLEAAHTGDYLTGTSLDVMQFRQKEMIKSTYEDLTGTLPQSPPLQCICDADDCTQCEKLDSWWSYFRSTVDTLVNMVNVHSCHENTYPDGMLKKNATSKGCKDNKWGKCRG